MPPMKTDKNDAAPQIPPDDGDAHRPAPETPPQAKPRGLALIHALKASGGILVSRLTGIIRSIAFAGYWGASGISQAAYNTAFAVPNSLRMLFGEGAFSAALVPFLTDHLVKEDRQGAWHLAERVISVQILVLAACVLFVSALAGILSLTTPWDMSPQTSRTLFILPVLMPYALIICVAGAFAAILNALRIFTLPYIVSVMYNGVQVLTILYLAFFFPDNAATTPLLIFCGGAVLSGLLHLVVLMLACRRQGFAFHFRPDWTDPEVRLLCRKMIPGLIGTGVMQLNSLIDRGLGLILGPVAIGALAYSQNLVYLPVGVFGVAMGAVGLSAMSRACSGGDQEELRRSLTFALRQLLFLSLPCATALAVLSRPLIQLLFQRGAFTAEATEATAWTFGFYLAGLPAFCLAKVATNPFHARKDTATPVKISLACVGLNLCLNLILMQFIRQAGLALSTSLCSWINVITLLVINKRHLDGWSFRPILASATRLLAAALAAAAAAKATLALAPGLLQLAPFTPGPRTTTLALAATAAVAAAITYLAAACLLRCPEIAELRDSLRRRRRA